jgi:hypothetical protein
MNISLNLQIDYTINKIFTKKKFDYIVYRFNLKNITLVKGMLTKYDLITTLPYLESINADYFSIIDDHIISCIITELNEKLGIEIDREDFIKENIDMLKTFICELKTNVKDIQVMLNETNKKKK